MDAVPRNRVHLLGEVALQVVDDRDALRAVQLAALGLDQLVHAGVLTL
jgi:hypothetical protein